MGNNTENTIMTHCESSVLLLVYFLLIPVAIGIDDSSSEGLKKLSSEGTSGKDQGLSALVGA